MKSYSTLLSRCQQVSLACLVQQLEAQIKLEKDCLNLRRFTIPWKSFSNQRKITNVLDYDNSMIDKKYILVSQRGENMGNFRWMLYIKKFNSVIISKSPRRIRTQDCVSQARYLNHWANAIYNQIHWFKQFNKYTKSPSSDVVSWGVPSLIASSKPVKKIFYVRCNLPVHS